VGTLTRIALAAAAVAAAAVAGLLLLARGTPTPGLRPTAPLTARASFDPPVVQFGDRVVARLVVLADRRAVDAGSLRVSQDVAPLTQLGPVRVSRTTRGDLVVVSYELPAACLSDACLARAGPLQLRLPAARVEAPQRGGGTVAAVAARPLLEVRGRVTAADLAPSRPPFQADVAAPAVDYRIGPATLSLLLEVAAAMLAAAAVALAVRQATLLVRRRERDTRSELERALALIREAESRPPGDRRRAVGLLARLLRPRDEQLAGAARDLAWSEPAPTPEALAGLREQVSREVDGA
jgi:hypothetical protein